MSNRRNHRIGAQRRFSEAWFAILVLLLIASPRIAEACAVCSSGREDENRLAFILTTAFLTFLPLSMVAGVIWWMKKRIVEQERAHEEARRQHGTAAGEDNLPSWAVGR